MIQKVYCPYKSFLCSVFTSHLPSSESKLIIYYHLFYLLSPNEIGIILKNHVKDLNKENYKTPM